VSKQQIVEYGKNIAFTRISRFMNDGDIVLNAEEEEILLRWIYCDKQILQRKYTEKQIIDKIVENFGVSSYTALRDIYQTQALFGAAIKANKKYLLHHHAENILLTIERYKTDKSLVHLVPKLFEAYTKAVVAIPDEINNNTQPPPQMNFFILPGQQVSNVKSFEDAIANISKRMNSNNIQDADFEDIDQ